MLALASEKTHTSVTVEVAFCNTGQPTRYNASVIWSTESSELEINTCEICAEKSSEIPPQRTILIRDMVSRLMFQNAMKLVTLIGTEAIAKLTARNIVDEKLTIRK